MKDRRNNFSGEFKTKVALEAIKGLRTVSEIAGKYGVHPHQSTQWKNYVRVGPKCPACQLISPTGISAIWRWNGILACGLSRCQRPVFRLR
jgi:hypothetical protein